MRLEPELLVEEGVQAGLALPLAPGSSLVGSDFDSCVVIADTALLPGHFEIRYDDGFAVLRAVAGDVVLADGTWLSPGQDVACPETCSFVAGNTRFGLRLPAGGRATIAGSGDLAVGPSSARPQKALISVVSGVLAVVAIGVLAFTAIGLRSGEANPALVARSIVPATPAHTDAVKDVVSALRTRLDAAGLAAIAVTPVKDGSIIVQGSLFPSQLAAWTSVREWYDTEFGTGRVLVDQVNGTSAPPKLAIAAVWAGANPYVIDDSGNKLFPGATLGSGWTIQAIQGGHIIVNNGEQKLAIRY